MNPETLLLLIVSIADIALWSVAITLPLSPTNQFRAFACASLLLFVLAGYLFGWGVATAVAAVVTWVAAIMVANVRSSAA